MSPRQNAGISPGPRRCGLLTAIILVAGLAVAFPFSTNRTLDPQQTQIPWWALAIIVYLAELTVVHMRYHRHAQSFSMSEVPLVLGLFMTAPARACSPPNSSVTLPR